MALFAFKHRRDDHLSKSLFQKRDFLLAVLLTILLDRANSNWTAAWANGLKIDEDGSQNVNVTIQESLVPKASIKRTDNQMIIQVPENSGFDPSTLQMNPALKGKVDVVQTGGEKGVPKKTVVTIHSGNIYLNVDNQQNSPPVPVGRSASREKEPEVSIPRNTRMAKPNVMAPLTALNSERTNLQQRVTPKPPRVQHVSETQLTPKKPVKGLELPNPFGNPLAMFQGKSPEQKEKLTKPVLSPEALAAKRGRFQPLSSTAVVTKPVVRTVEVQQPTSPSVLSVENATSEKSLPSLQLPISLPQEQKLPDAGNQDVLTEADFESTSSQTESELKTSETEGKSGIPLSQILPNHSKEGVVPSDVLWRTLASTFLVLVMVVVSIKLGLPKLVSRYPEWFQRLQEQSKSKSTSNKTRQDKQRNTKKHDSTHQATPSYRTKGKLKSKASQANVASKTSQTVLYNHNKTSILTDAVTNPDPKTDWKSRIFNQATAFKAKPPQVKLLPAVQTFKSAHLETFANEGMTLVNHLPLSENRDLYWVTMEMDKTKRNLVIAATGDQMSLVTHFMDGEDPELALPQPVYDLLGEPSQSNLPPASYTSSESLQTLLPLEQLPSSQSRQSKESQPKLTEDKTFAFVEPLARPEELSLDPTMAERYAQRKSFKRLSQWMSGRETSDEHNRNQENERKQDVRQKNSNVAQPLEHLTPRDALKQFATPPSYESQAYEPQGLKKPIKKSTHPENEIIEAEEVLVLEDYDDVYHPY